MYDGTTLARTCWDRLNWVLGKLLQAIVMNPDISVDQNYVPLNDLDGKNWAW
jgi:hypothetical protein